MALPSSPPLLCQDPPSSPPSLPTLSSFSLPSNFNAGRKRLHSDYGSLSSDPLFSEDTSELDFNDESEQPRRKRLVKGPWWNVGRRAGKSLQKNMMKKEGFRNVDSGVFMGSDDSFESLHSDKGRLELPTREDRTRQLHRMERKNLSGDDPESYAAKVVQDCVENGKESIDLTSIGLTTISDATLYPLHQLIRHAHDDLTQPPSEDLFAPLTPSIQLYLWGNLLTSLPSELFHLENITVLSLRQNHLQELPPAIARLHKLTEINIASNQLSYLPWEMFELVRTAGESLKVTFGPNPFKVPHLAKHPESFGSSDFDTHHDVTDFSQSEMSIQLEARLALGRKALNGGDEDVTPKKKRNSREQLIFLAPSEIQYLDVSGFVVRPSQAMGTREENAWEAPVFYPQQPPQTPASSTAPSLFELALRSAQRNYDLRDLALPQSTPPIVCQGLQEAAKGVEYGNDRCSTCSKAFVIPRAQWLEYWYHGHDYYDLSEDKILPFKRKACSWACAQVTAEGTAYA